MNNHNKHYRQLSQQQRYQIYGLRKAGMSQKAIAQEAGVSSSTISRELKRNRTEKGYDPQGAQVLSDNRRRSADKADKRDPETDTIIRESLALGWSPAAISSRMGIECSGANRLSHTTIYRRISEDRQQGGLLHTRLPRYGKKRWKGGKRYRKAGVAAIPNRVDSSSRPEVVDQRSRLGDWEGDLVHGVNASLVTLVDRTSRFTLAQRVLRKSKEAVADALICMLGKVHSALTVTLDNGGEFADHDRVSKETGADMYFAKPYASWQRGTNENTNGRLRRLWPKRFDLATLADEDIQDGVFILNLTPRKVLDGLTPLEAFTGQRVALIT
ncbi:IS30 family transposase [Desulfosediminicola ganghwensis]|uniref:IS30 family transposase n=1 Tax=Desulfosediminicola ganghwensis TaxID=2569540 RepID=UPI0010AD9F1F|nr:IS30 family transposase [Desulfosediminicola ganghwensis]